jgi:hypothetical protein
MFCSACGLAVAPGLAFCKNCGAKLGGGPSDTADRPVEIKPERIILLMTMVFVFGLLAMAFLLGIMKGVLKLESEILLGVAGLSFLIMLGIEGMCIWLLVQRFRRVPAAGVSVPLPHKGTNELDPARVMLLTEPVTSVTDHTTRTLDPVYRQGERR